MHAADQDDIASGLRVAEAEYRLQRAGGGDEDGKKMDASHTWPPYALNWRSSE